MRRDVKTFVMLGMRVWSSRRLCHERRQAFKEIQIYVRVCAFQHLLIGITVIRVFFVISCIRDWSDETRMSVVRVQELTEWSACEQRSLGLTLEQVSGLIVKLEWIVG